MIHILLADDDKHIRELLQYHLQKEGYKVFGAEDGKVAQSLLEKENIHLAIVDIMMPFIDGYTLCEEIRKYYDIPVILLTAKDQLVDKEKGFISGTDDYIVKPFEPAEVIFRMKALLRRYQMLSADVITLHGTTIDRKSFEVKCNEQTILLPLKEFELLSQLASYPGRIFSREELIELVWGIDFEGDERTIDVHIKRLRDRFSKRTDDFQIKTVRGLGYKLELK
ncbi:response regulator transcription factor [Bacillus sp. DX1.1]|uniref:response regulator transcription factor n=1 Tax=unclassified Bacillus (in: firmicutes) TaxID=185979 RepID=UPI0025704FED|nr:MULTISPECIES: response regulator transcription factor [unclassified Bacillus (in: firmicutes)]MDM5155397.1 response regulator transcription factor [Bacillus sp. DX1.1]WJE79712.1 response regulator transcription factor [Bacillus sp. DX3.1]